MLFRTVAKNEVNTRAHRGQTQQGYKRRDANYNRMLLLLVVGCWGAKCCPFASMWPALFRCKASPVAFESEWLRAGGHVFERAFESSLCVLERSFSLSSIENNPSPK